MNSIFFDDKYSLASRRSKLWLPSEAPVGAPSQPSGDRQRFLLDAPPDMGTAPTITLGEMKTRIAAVTAKLDAGDGSEEYTECVSRTYYYEGINSYRMATTGDGYYGITPTEHEIDSGLAASSAVYEDIGHGVIPDKKGRFWFDGGDANLFSVELDDSISYDSTGDGVNNAIYYDRRVVASRPLPEGVYGTHFNERAYYFVPCEGYTTRREWTITVTAPDDVLHEAFFDPVAVGSAVAADGANGVLKPNTFTDANGASAAIRRISWESGTVEMALSPHDGLAGYVLDFIELDGSTALSLPIDRATADSANGALRWAAPSQPWESGDELMLRIRETRPNPPAFDADSYDFTIDVASPTGAAVGTVSATDPDGDDVTYSIAAGNDDGLFAIEADTGRIAVAGALFGESDASRALTVRASDGGGGTATAAVRVALESVCRNGVVVPDPDSKPGAVADCLVLYYGVREELAGSVGLDWSASAAMNEWKGVQTRGSDRVLGIKLGELGLDGTLPAALGRLDGLERIDLYENDLSGKIPAEIGALSRLKYLLLSENDLTGKMPSELGGLSALRELNLSGNRLSGAIPAELGGLSGLSELWLRNNLLSGAIPSALGRLDLEYLFLSGNALSGCMPSGLRDATYNDLNLLRLKDCPNVAPAFGRSSYAFSVVEDASVGTVVGAVSATDPDAGDAAAYSIVGGNGDGKFAIGADTGVIAVAGALDHETVASYALSVRAADGRGGAATVAVTITVTDVAD